MKVQGGPCLAGSFCRRVRVSHVPRAVVAGAMQVDVELGSRNFNPITSSAWVNGGPWDSR